MEAIFLIYLYFNTDTVNMDRFHTTCMHLALQVLQLYILCFRAYACDLKKSQEVSSSNTGNVRRCVTISAHGLHGVSPNRVFLEDCCQSVEMLELI